MSTSSPSRRTGLPLRARLATTVGGAAGRASRLAGRGDGSVIGGVIGLRLKPDLLALLARGRQVVLVTGTNGKTTTTRLITAALGSTGQQVASNAFGANMEAGLVSALARAPDAAMAVLEVDEKYMPAMLATTHARVVTLLNLSRDQMDRAAEIWLLARRWRAALAAARLPGDRQRRRPAGGLGRRAGAPGHLGGRGPALARRLLVLPEVRVAPAPRRRRLVLRRVLVPPPAGQLGAGGRSGDRPDRPVPRAGPVAARPGQPVQRGDRAGGGGCVRRRRRRRRCAALAQVRSVAGRYTQIERRGCGAAAAAGQEPGRLAGGA